MFSLFYSCSLSQIPCESFLSKVSLVDDLWKRSGLVGAPSAEPTSQIPAPKAKLHKQRIKLGATDDSLTNGLISISVTTVTTESTTASLAAADTPSTIANAITKTSTTKKDPIMCPNKTSITAQYDYYVQSHYHDLILG